MAVYFFSKFERAIPGLFAKKSKCIHLFQKKYWFFCAIIFNNWFSEFEKNFLRLSRIFFVWLSKLNCTCPEHFKKQIFDFFKKFFRGLDEGIVGLLSKKVRHVCRNWFLRFQTTVSTKHNFLREKNFLNVWFRKVSENYLDCWQKKFRHVGENGNLLVQRKVMVKNLFSLSIRW